MTWRYPDRRAGTVFAVMTDIHFGYRDWTADQVERAGHDIDRLAPYLDGVLLTGDTTHWRNETPEDGEALAWLRARPGSDGWVMVPGNHDLSSFGFETHPWRTATEWGDRYGRPAKSITRIGDISVIGFSPEVWTWTAPEGFGPMPLTEADAAWLDEALWSEAPRPCWVACHVPLPAQYPGYLTAPASFDEVLAKNLNLHGWVSGHRHHDLTGGTENTGVYAYGSNRVIQINCPPTGGKPLGSLDTRFDDVVCTTFITYKDGVATIRWRDHLNERWAQATDGYLRTIVRGI